MNNDQFIELWNLSESARDFSVKSGISVHAASVRACRLRHSGSNVKKMPHKTAMPIEYRFWAMVQKADKCWIWTGSKNRKGYGQISTKRGGCPLLAHRLSYEINCGEIPGGQMVLHRCDNPSCVRPDHLFLGSAANNTHDMMQKLRGHWQENAPHLQIAKHELA